MKQTQGTTIHHRRSIRRAALKGLTSSSEANPSCSIPTGLTHNNKSPYARQIGALLIALAAFALLFFLVASSYREIVTHGVQASRESRSEELSRLSDEARQQLEMDLSNSTLAEDIATMRAYQKALTNQLRITAAELESHPRDRTLLERRRLIEVLIANAGGTGVNNQLAAIETARRMVESKAVSTQAEEARVRKMMADIRSNAESWKTGALASAAKLVGLRWENGKGLAIGIPYVWGARGWEPDHVAADACQQR